MHQLRQFVRFYKSLWNSSNQALIYRTTRKLSTTNKPIIILGIETSCDDTGIAIVDSNGKILGEAHHSQLVKHLIEGGINPTTARDLHKENIYNVYEQCIKSANIELSDVDAIAVTLEPGLPLSLIVGRDLAQQLSRSFNKPVIPIHHMQAHALMARMIEKVEFPFLVLLISGGHCLLAFAEAVDQFKILGQTTDDAPGEAFDKIGRSLKLINIPEYSQISGGQAIELASLKADNPDQFQFPLPLTHYRDCNFSFSGLKSAAKRFISIERAKHNLTEDELIPSMNNLCAGFLQIIIRHICIRTERAMEFIEKRELISKNKKTLIVSGGVASNNIFAKCLEKLCSERGYKFIRPPPKLCTDNGIMVAWNGIEKYNAGIGVLRNPEEIDAIDIRHRAPIGENWSKILTDEGIKRKWIKIYLRNIIGR
ncbi:tRNA N6-adenosine threonylcarbamoyltransferase, mitochondrial [Phymastichus coffea]|uniref:tRNA N6-adenosine threonylcarbamoyltransferase, mitochondrial n=1 Tax=Phymastichus coffea TaxID=108790 RepID=UPI00273B5E8E|nr:tRNA N6-adenosine threonylcarbamoyltransferase, mitochondrial [Phymastichus coffea]